MGGLSAAVLDPNGRFTTSSCQVMARGFRDFVQAMNNEPDVGGRVYVLSRTSVTANAVSEVRVGNVPDVQRRRRNKLVEQYEPALVAS
jgi:hypothetical protein